MLQLEILVRKGLGAVDTGTASSITVQEVSSLDHEVADLIL